MTDDERFMRVALDEARKSEAEGNTPVAAVIVYDGKAIGIGRNQVRTKGDPTAHAEVEALRDACGKVGERYLQGHVCYTTMEPCPMCCWALIEGGMGRLVLGARHRKLGRTDYGRYSVEELWRMTGRAPMLTGGVCETDCEDMRLTWMQAHGAET